MALQLSTALEILARLKTAAPPATAARLGQVAALMQALAQENAFLNAQVQEYPTLLTETLQAPAAPEPAPPAADETLTPSPAEAPTVPVQDDISESMAVQLMTGMNDALRAPLIAIRGRAELIEAGMLGQITGEQIAWLKAIQENTDRSFRMLDAIQRLIAIQKGEVRIELSNFIASELLQEAHARIQDRAQAHQHTLSVQVPNHVPMARGDFFQSMIILSDLLDNAVRYTPDGGTIRLSIDNLGSHVLFSVADSGIGLRPEVMDQVGTAFWRDESQPLVRESTGTGLSLFLAKQMLALQGGELIFSGQADLGSTFSFTLATPTPDTDALGSKSA